MQRRSAVPESRKQSGRSWVLGARSLTLALLTSHGLGACGRKQAPPDAAPRVAPPLMTPRPPATYAFDDGDCQLSLNPTSLPITKGQIYSWQGSHVVPLDVDYHGTASADSLSSDAIATTVAGATYQRSCQGGPATGFVCNGGDKGWAPVRTGAPLRLCRDQAAYQRQSVESISLTSLYFIQAARDRYLAVTAADATQAPAPAPIALSIMPAFVTDFIHPGKDGKEQVTRTFIVDNLAYFPDAQMIAVFPVQAAEKDHNDGFYWESSFVLGHEYGHHIDFARHGRVLTNVGLTWNPLLHGFSDESALASGGNSSSARAQMAGAEAEGFADLLGYYVGNADGQAIIGLPRIGRDRDPGSATFGQSDPKILTTARLNKLLGLASLDIDADIDPAFADIHQTGAVIAYTANQVFATLMAATSQLAPGSRDEIDGRYRLTLTFMDALVAEVAQLRPDEGGTAVSQPIGRAFEQVTLAAIAKSTPQTTSNELKNAVCKIISRQMPGLTYLPFSSGGHCG